MVTGLLTPSLAALAAQVFNLTGVLRWCGRKFRHERHALFTELPALKRGSGPRGTAARGTTLSVLQATVVNGAAAAFDALVGPAGGIRIAVGEVPREHGLSPLRLAARVGKVRMLERVIYTLDPTQCTSSAHVECRCMRMYI